MPGRDIDDYQERYEHLPFEPAMSAIRKKMILQFLAQRGAKDIIEVGCGQDSILNHYTAYDRLMVVEPSKVFFRQLAEDAQKQAGKHIVLINELFSAKIFSGYDLSTTDTILISSLLHELEAPGILLGEVYNVCNARTVVHINVPNANSLHRLLAVEMGLIQDVKQKSELQQALQQHSTYDLESLGELVQAQGFRILDSGSHFIKPFTHRQMDVLQHHPMFGERVIEGLEKLIRHLPDYGAEIYMNLVRK